jgi:hypothetical protein
MARAEQNNTYFKNSFMTKVAQLLEFKKRGTGTLWIPTMTFTTSLAMLLRLMALTAFSYGSPSDGLSLTLVL